MHWARSAWVIMSEPAAESGVALGPEGPPTHARAPSAPSMVAQGLSGQGAAAAGTLQQLEDVGQPAAQQSQASGAEGRATSSNWSRSDGAEPAEAADAAHIQDQAARSLQPQRLLASLDDAYARPAAASAQMQTPAAAAQLAS